MEDLARDGADPHLALVREIPRAHVQSHPSRGADGPQVDPMLVDGVRGRSVVGPAELCGLLRAEGERQLGPRGRQVPLGVTDRAVLPVDETDDPILGPQDVAGPEVTVEQHRGRVAGARLLDHRVRVDLGEQPSEDIPRLARGVDGERQAQVDEPLHRRRVDLEGEPGELGHRDGRLRQVGGAVEVLEDEPLLTAGVDKHGPTDGEAGVAEDREKPAHPAQLLAPTTHLGEPARCTRDDATPFASEVEVEQRGLGGDPAGEVLHRHEPAAEALGEDRIRLLALHGAKIVRMPLSRLRRTIGMSLRAKVAGDNPSARAAKVWGVSGERWFTEDDPIWRVHADASMFVGGIRSLLLQSLHPLAMAGVEDHSDYRSDPWMRVSNTSFFIAQTTFGTIDNAHRLIEAIRIMHDRVVGTAADGRPYAASDPHLLLWVHVAEIETFLTCYQTFSPARLSPSEADTYVEQTAHVARLLGVLDPPLTVRDLHEVIEAYRPELELTDAARRAADFLLHEPPVAGPETIGYRLLASAAVRTLQPWARDMLGIRTLPLPDRLVRRVLNTPTVSTVRWLLTDPQVAQDRVIGHAAAGRGANGLSRDG